MPYATPAYTVPCRYCGSQITQNSAGVWIHLGVGGTAVCVSRPQERV